MKTLLGAVSCQNPVSKFVFKANKGSSEGSVDMTPLVQWTQDDHIYCVYWTHHNHSKHVGHKPKIFRKGTIFCTAVVSKTAPNKPLQMFPFL